MRTAHPEAPPARGLIVERLTACGVQQAGDDGLLQVIAAGRGTNVIGRIGGPAAVGAEPAGAEPAGAVLLSAHYDHQGGTWRTHPGAYDNVTSVAVVLELACQLATAPPRHDVVIALWDAEEPPTFLTDAMGSAWWVAHPTVPHVRTALVLDLLGEGLWEGYLGTFALGVESSPALARLGQSLAVPGLKPAVASLALVEDLVTGQHQAWSDYDAFRARRVPFVFFTDGQNVRYHTPQDTADAVDYAKLAAETAWIGAWTRGVADLETLPTWAPQRDLAQDRAVVRSVIQDAVTAAPFSDSVNTAVALGLTDSDPARAAQRLMCYAGSEHPGWMCAFL